MRASLRGLGAAALLAAALAAGLQILGALDLSALAKGTQSNADYTIQVSPEVTLGTADIGNHCDDCVTLVTLPFSYQLYGQTFTTANVSSNGNIQFASANIACCNTTLPAAGFSHTIFGLWDDLQTQTAGLGIFTSTTGASPNRIFNVEWRAALVAPATYTPVNFLVRLFEGKQKAEVVYISGTNPGGLATVGVQATTAFTQYSYNNGANVVNGRRVTFDLSGAPTGFVLAGMTASRRPGGVLVRWRSVSNVGVLGFNVWRKTGAGRFAKRSALVAAKGGAASPAYSWLDRTARPGLAHTYRLEVVGVDGTRTFSGSARVSR